MKDSFVEVRKQNGKLQCIIDYIYNSRGILHCNQCVIKETIVHLYNLDPLFSLIFKSFSMLL